MPSEATDPLLENLEQALMRGNARAASESFQQLVAMAEAPVHLGKSVGKILGRLLDDFQAVEILAFSDWLTRHSAVEVAQTALAEIRDELQEIREWRGRLGDLAIESRARELRSLVRARKVGEAARAALAILKRGDNEESRMRLARQIGA
ncbi:hypothetical protein HQ520_00560, partial [bacterium]|nr:hypothetical protein [bacterium]